MSLMRFICLSIIGLLLAACALEPEYNRYQSPPEQNRPGQSGAVAELQRNAREALSRRAYQQAIDYLQRAIRIEPRNPFSWHYLAETYWRSGDPARCLQMVERSFSYSTSRDRLEDANQKLKARCQPG